MSMAQVYDRYRGFKMITAHARCNLYLITFNIVSLASSAILVINHIKI